MNKHSTSIAPNLRLSRGAFALSLVVHAGLLGIFSGWVWDFPRTFEKSSKAIHIKILKPREQTIPKILESQITPGKPVQAKRTNPSANRTLNHKTPTPVINKTFEARVPHNLSRSQKTIQIHRSNHKWIEKITSSNKNRPYNLGSITPHTRFSKTLATKRPEAFKPKRKYHPGKQINLFMNQEKIRKASLSPRPTKHTYSRENTLKQSTHVSIQQIQSPHSKLSLSPRKAQSSPTYPLTEGSTPAALFLEQQPLSTKSNLNIRKASVPRKPSIQSGIQDDISEINLSLLRGNFTGKVRQRISEAKYYPRLARRRGMEGQPIIQFTIDKQGRVTQVKLDESSGYNLLDKAALEAVNRAAPYPPIPDNLKMDVFHFKLPISFILK